MCVSWVTRLFQETAGPFPASADVDVRGGGEAAGNNPLCSFLTLSRVFFPVTEQPPHHTVMHKPHICRRKEGSVLAPGEILAGDHFHTCFPTFCAS